MHRRNGTGDSKFASAGLFRVLHVPGVEYKAGSGQPQRPASGPQLILDASVELAAVFDKADSGISQTLGHRSKIGVASI
jgi:hypothetical protein